MRHRTPLMVVVIAALALTGCAAPIFQPESAVDSHNTHTMPDGGEMSGSDHSTTVGPSLAAQMICDGQVVDAVVAVVGLANAPVPNTVWQSPVFSCTFEIDGKPLVLSVHDATDIAVGEQHFAAVRESYVDAENIEGMLGLGLPSFATPDGVVAFLRDGKTLLVDATALPAELGPNGTRNQQQVAYALASSVLVCWVQHE